MPALHTFARSFLRHLRPDARTVEGSVIPIPDMRFCGDNFREDGAFLRSAEREARRLIDECGLTHDSAVLDIGCGTGRLPIGILRTTGEIARYQGVDVSEAAVQWCTRHIERAHPSFRFLHIDWKNERYNRGGTRIDAAWKLPLADASFDIVYLFSVFSHLKTEDVQTYLREFRRLLRPGGRVFLTAFVAPGVPDMVENPAGYKREWKGPLHCVRFDEVFFASLVEEAGFCIVKRTFEQEADEQTGYYLALR